MFKKRKPAKVQDAKTFWYERKSKLAERAKNNSLVFDTNKITNGADRKKAFSPTSFTIQHFYTIK